MILDCPSCGARVRVPDARIAESARCAKCKAEIAPVDRPLPVHSSAEFDALVAPELRWRSNSHPPGAVSKENAVAG